ncbi:hypothetical protein CRYUN_Cryun06bG0045400 [Craigia yunnanensis]
MIVFSKTLTNIGVRLSFPLKALNCFDFPEGKDKMEFECTDSSGKSWKFGLSKARHSHPKLVLSSGWRAYVQAMGLKMNDRFILDDRKDIVFQNKIQSSSREKSPCTVQAIRQGDRG